jgi:hypothetical protein
MCNFSLRTHADKPPIIMVKMTSAAHSTIIVITHVSFFITGIASATVEELGPLSPAVVSPSGACVVVPPVSQSVSRDADGAVGEWGV